MLVREFAVVSYRWYLPLRASTFVIPSSLGVSDFDIDSRHRPKIRLGHLGLFFPVPHSPKIVTQNRIEEYLACRWHNSALRACG